MTKHKEYHLDLAALDLMGTISIPRIKCALDELDDVEIRGGKPATGRLGRAIELARAVRTIYQGSVDAQIQSVDTRQGDSAPVLIAR